MRFIALKAAAAMAALVICAAARAELPYGTLEFIQPTGTVAPNEQIDVWLRFTLSADSPALSFSSNPLTGFDPQDIPTTGQYLNPSTNAYETRDFAQVTGASLNTYLVCDTSFLNVCSDSSNYSFSFFTSSQPGMPSVNFLDNFNLAPGQHHDYLFGHFNPAAGGAQSGTYQLFGAGLTVSFTGTDAEGNYLSTFGSDLASTCPGGHNDGCAFTRTVVPSIPEPQTYALMLAGLAMVVGLQRRRASAMSDRRSYDIESR